MGAADTARQLGYTLRDVARLLQLSEHQVRNFVRDGFLRPAIGSRGEYRFTFQDLVLLRTARELMSNRVPAHKLRSALRKLREQLPTGARLTSMRITADGEDIVVRNGAEAWEPESGQAVLPFDPETTLEADVQRLTRPAVRTEPAPEDYLSAEDWYEIGCDLEAVDVEQSRDAYRRALERDPVHVDARINLGRVLHEQGQLKSAEVHYRMALAAHPKNATAAFNLGVVYEDLDRPTSALQAYELAMRADPQYADAYYNAGHLCERMGRTQQAVRYFQTFRRLTGR